MQGTNEQSTEPGLEIAAEVSNTAPPFEDGIVAIAQHIWNYKLFRVNDTTIDVSQIIIALLVLILGVALAKIISRRIGGTVLPSMRVDPGPSAAIQSISYYVMLAAAIMMSLQIAGVPLTIFTIFGGALALGIGFGSQNIVNNFISGLLLLIERPVHIGDLVSICGDVGTVVKIGARSTHLRGYDGATFIVPNSVLLENTMTNWTISDRAVRSIVGVGVAYGTEIEKVRAILEQTMKDHDRVVQRLENRVLFREFGDSALNFEIHFWTHPRSVLDKNTIESDMRFAIDQHCRDKDISIAFPQRDVHIDSIAPLDIRVLKGD